MELRLSNYEFRAFRKASGFVSLHLRSHILIETNASFSISAYWQSMRAHLALPSSEPMLLDSVAIDEAALCPYNGAVQVHGFYLSHVSHLRTIQPSLGRLRLEYRFNFHGGVIEGAHEREAVVMRGCHSGWPAAA